MKGIGRIFSLCTDIDERFDQRLASGFPDAAAHQISNDQAGRGSPYALTIKHCAVRNQIAHGRLQATRISVSAFVQDCTIIQAALHRAL